MITEPICSRHGDTSWIMQATKDYNVWQCSEQFICKLCDPLYPKGS